MRMQKEIARQEAPQQEEIPEEKLPSLMGSIGRTAGGAAMTTFMGGLSVVSGVGSLIMGMAAAGTYMKGPAGRAMSRSSRETSMDGVEATGALMDKTVEWGAYTAASFRDVMKSMRRTA